MRAEVIKLLDVGIIYRIFKIKWVSPIYVAPKRDGLTVVKNKDDELVPTRIHSGWSKCKGRRINQIHYNLSSKNMELLNSKDEPVIIGKA
jgi:hypothetical protein